MELERFKSMRLHTGRSPNTVPLYFNLHIQASNQIRPNPTKSNLTKPKTESRLPEFSLPSQEKLQKHIRPREGQRPEIKLAQRGGGGDQRRSVDGRAGRARNERTPWVCVPNHAKP